jgi:hypothetical protein
MINLDEDAGLQSVIIDVISAIMMIRTMAILIAGCGCLGQTDTFLKYCGTVGKPGGKKEKTNLNMWHEKKPVYSTQFNHFLVRN